MKVTTEMVVKERSVDLEAQAPEEVACDHLVWYNSRHREGIFTNYIPLYS